MDLELDFEKRFRLVREIIETVVLTLLMFLIIRLAVQNFNIDGMSMEPNLHDQELVLVDKWSYLIHPPNRGDVIVFVAPPQPSQDYIKRIIGLPGDVITIQDTKVVVNNQPLDERYIDPHRQGNPYGPITNLVVPDNAYFVLGDNRGGSSDSRDWGCVPSKNVIGRAALVYWPLGKDNNGLLPNVSATFSHVPTPKPTSSNMCRVMMGPAPAAVGAPTNHPTDQSMNTLLVLALPGASVMVRRKRVQA